MSRPLKYAVIGLGRMGARHARNIAYATPRAELVAVCDPLPATLSRAREYLPPDIIGYDNIHKCLADSGAEAVLIASSTGSHALDAIKSMEAGKVGNDELWTCWLMVRVC